LIRQLRFVDHWLRGSRLLLFTLVVCVVATPAMGQDDDPGLGTRESGSPGRDSGFAIRGSASDNARLIREIGAAAGRAGDAKAAFVTALRGFAEGLSGTHGDEGPRIRTALANMRIALRRWDDAIGGFRAARSVSWTAGQANAGYLGAGPDAALSATLEALQMCIDRGVDINAFNTTGQTALHVAAGRGLDGVVKFLAEHGAKLDRTDKQGRTPLDVALGVGAGASRGNNRNAGGPRESTAALLRQLMSESGRTSTSLQ
jgi:hypothetical protein